MIQVTPDLAKKLEISPSLHQNCAQMWTIEAECRANRSQQEVLQ